MLLLKDSKFDFWLDGMGKTVNGIYLDFPEFLRSAKRLRQALNRTNVVRNGRARGRAGEGEVMKFDFAARAGHTELLAFAKACEPQKIVLMHGDDREILAGDLRAQGFEVLLPKNGEK